MRRYVIIAPDGRTISGEAKDALEVQRRVLRTLEDEVWSFCGITDDSPVFVGGDKGQALRQFKAGDFREPK